MDRMHRIRQKILRCFILCILYIHVDKGSSSPNFFAFVAACFRTRFRAGLGTDILERGGRAQRRHRFG